MYQIAAKIAITHFKQAANLWTKANLRAISANFTSKKHNLSYKQATLA